MPKLDGNEVMLENLTIVGATPSQKQREIQQRVKMIKDLRCLTKVLGKLGIRYLIRDNEQLYINAPSGWGGKKPIEYVRYSYGWGLREAKYFVDNYINKLSAK